MNDNVEVMEIEGRVAIPIDFTRTEKKTSPKQRKQRAHKVTLDEYLIDCEKKQEELKQAQPISAQSEVDESVEPSAQALRRKRKKEAAKAKKNAGWESTVPKKEESVGGPEFRNPSDWTRALYKATETPKAQTTLILKGLPYDLAGDKDLKEYLKKRAGSVKFINMVHKDEKFTGTAFVRFETKEGADRGLTLNGFFCNGRKVAVEYARERK